MNETGSSQSILRNEHPYLIRLTHWINAVSLTVLILSGLEIFHAFPSFGAKIPQHNLIDIPRLARLGGWLGGALRWHFTFMWIFAINSAIYLATLIRKNGWHHLQITQTDARGLWPMFRHYFLFGPKPEVADGYNPLQKLAYISALALAALSLISGILLYKPVQFALAANFGRTFQAVRILHFGAMLGLVSFIPGHLMMVALHGWQNFWSMVVGFRKVELRAPTPVSLKEVINRPSTLT